jgi:hypothetical protein
MALMGHRIPTRMMTRIRTTRRKMNHLSPLLLLLPRLPPPLLLPLS